MWSTVFNDEVYSPHSHMDSIVIHRQTNRLTDKYKYNITDTIKTKLKEKIKTRIKN